MKSFPSHLAISIATLVATATTARACVKAHAYLTTHPLANDVMYMQIREDRDADGVTVTLCEGTGYNYFSDSEDHYSIECPFLEGGGTNYLEVWDNGRQGMLEKRYDDQPVGLHALGPMNRDQSTYCCSYDDYGGCIFYCSWWETCFHAEGTLCDAAPQGESCNMCGTDGSVEYCLDL
ncbi:hypothetical protein BDW59DRAFT_160281 [Aspergillus cavernicola]|uniref:Uncharacterized protein n=1 Tax=Aspergillus cavernicola TaxID=176166 RepID=A0ABR4IHS9_9EURO